VSLFFPAQAGVPVEPAVRPSDSVIVVDDQPDVLELTCELFKTLGLNPIPAASAREALNALQRHEHVELMLTDVTMPGMSGVELARKARELQPGLKVILASGYSGPAHAAAGGQLEGFAFLAKPYKLADLVRKLRDVG
jgi:CheY-like chemotaxis protein